LDQAAPSVRQGISALRPHAAAGDAATPAQDMRISAVALAIERSIQVWWIGGARAAQRMSLVEAVVKHTTILGPADEHRLFVA